MDWCSTDVRRQLLLHMITSGLGLKSLLGMLIYGPVARLPSQSMRPCCTRRVYCRSDGRCNSYRPSCTNDQLMTTSNRCRCLLVMRISTSSQPRPHSHCSGIPRGSCHSPSPWGCVLAQTTSGHYTDQSISQSIFVYYGMTKWGD